MFVRIIHKWLRLPSGGGNLSLHGLPADVEAERKKVYARIAEFTRQQNSK